VVSGSLGEQFVLWQWATAMAGYLLQINPFDQPDVESAKAATRALLGVRPDPVTPLAVEKGVAISAQNLGIDVSQALVSAWQGVIEHAGTRGYIALQVYADRQAEGPWDTLRATLAELSGRPVTLGFGPRFLHSTGQFHKGGRPTGVFVQIEVPASHTVAIPGYPFDFGQLIDAQAAGDCQVLASRGLPVLTLRLTSEESASALMRAVDALR
jgi:glucose-6-phosphate isomerase